MTKSTYDKIAIFPVKITAETGAENSDKLLQEKTLQIVMPCAGVTSLLPNGQVILDFGKEIYGNIKILLGEKEIPSQPLRVILGESAAETFCTAENSESCNDHSVRDISFTSSGYAEFTTPKTGFRFARIVNGKGYTDLFAVAAESEFLSAERKGYFRCNDEEVNKIAETALYTAALCVQNGVIWDGLKRDRLVWMGDLHPELLTLSQAYGAIQEIKNSLEYIKPYLKTSWCNLHPAYSAWWIICLAEYYVISADDRFVKERLYIVGEIAAEFRKVVKADGGTDFSKSDLRYYEDCEYFLDWPTALKEESKIGWASLVKIAMEKAADLLERFGEDGSIAKGVAEDVARGKKEDTRYKQIAAINYLSGRSGNEVKETLVQGGGKGMTSFMAYYILTAAAQSGGGKDVLCMLKEFYGGMLRLGATSFWEDFDVEWLNDDPQGLEFLPSDRKNIHRDYGKFCYKSYRHSLCHGWSSGVYAFLTRCVLGIHPVAAGYKTVAIRPRSIGLTYAEGGVPTPYGTIFVKWRTEKEKIICEVDAPSQIEIVKDGDFELKRISCGNAEK